MELAKFGYSAVPPGFGLRFLATVNGLVTFMFFKGLLLACWFFFKVYSLFPGLGLKSGKKDR